MVRNHRAGEEAAAQADMEIRATKLEYCTCNSCRAQNYDPSMACGLGRYEKRIFDVQAGAIILHLCRDCLRELAREARQAVKG